MSSINQEIDVAGTVRELGLPESGLAYVTRALETGPTRSVSDGATNVTGFLPIPYLQYSVPFESRSFERVCLAQLAFNDGVVAIIAQPPAIKLKWRRNDKRRVSAWHTPDYLVVYKDRAELIEAKPFDQLIEGSKKSRDRFKKSPNGDWISPAGIRATNDMGLCYEIFCPDQSDRTLQRNLDFVWDYLWRSLKPNHESDIETVVSIVADAKHILLKDLLHAVGDADAVYLAIARKAVSFSWRTDLLRSPETATVYVDNLHRDALSKAPIHQLTPEAAPTSLSVGKYLRWIGTEWSVLSIREETVTLVNTEHRIATLTLKEITHLIATEAIRVCSHQDSRRDDEAQAILRSASSAALEEACNRYSKLQRYLSGDHDCIPGRTARDWKRKVEDAERRYGIPIIGLIARHGDKGRIDSPVDPLAKKLALQSISEHYETEAARSGKAAYLLYVGVSRDQGVEPVSYGTYMKYVQKRDKSRQNRRRHGRRFANQHRGPFMQGLEALPHNGDRAWEVAHIDHTPADIETVSAITGENLGQPWLTFMIDAWSRMILAMVLTFSAPSRVSLMMIIRECVRRWGRLPNNLVVDRGPEFRSTYFDKLLSGFIVSKLLRPTADPVFGSPGERIFGTANTSVTHQLIGNTKNRVLRRGLSSSHDPAKFAIWTPDAYAELLEEWAFDVYPHDHHCGIGEAPMQRYERSIQESGARDLVRIPYSSAFLFATLPEAPNNPTRKVHRGTISIDNMEYRGLHESVNCFNGQTGQARIVPDDPSKAWIFLNNEWRELVCTNDLVREYVERAIKHSRLELSARLSRSGTKLKDVDTGLIRLLEGAALKEEELRIQKAELIATPHASLHRNVGPEDTTDELYLPVVNMNVSESYNLEEI